MVLYSLNTRGIVWVGLGLGSYVSIEWNLIRLGNPVDGIVTKTVYNTRPGSHFYLSKTGPCAVISIQISSKFTEIVHCLLYIPPLAFLVSMLSIVQEFRRAKDRDFLPFDKQVFGGWVVNMGE